MQYPTIAQPQYGFAPTMPGMAGGGLAALANQYRKGGGVRYFEEGGDSSGGEGPGTGNDAGVSDSPSDPGSGPSGGGGGADPGAAAPGAAAQAAAQGVDNAVAAAQDAQQEAAAEATLGAQVAAEADEAEAENAATTAAALGTQANAIAAEIAANQEEDAKNAEMAAVMSGQVAGFPGPSQEAPAFGISFQNPFNTNVKEAFGMFNPAVSVQTPMGVYGISPMDVAAPAMGRGASAVNSAVNAGRALGFAEGGLAAAQQTQSKGRGQDTMLVHMTPGEVKGLQALAMSQGGSLTINPQTGLPEAGFLSAILPMVAGFALGPAGFGLMSSLGAGATVGALTGVATGSLKKGLMAGLGAYGGAGLGQGLQAAAGTPENLISANPPYNPDLLTTYGPPPTSPLGIGSEGASISAGTYTPTPAVTPDMSTLSGTAGDFVPSTTGPVPGSGGQALGSVAKDTTYAQLPPPPPVQATGIDAITGGTKAMIQPGAEGAAARARFGAALPYGTTIAAGVPLASAAAEPPKGPEPSKSYIRGYDLNITNPSGTPQYTPQDTREREQVRYAFSPRPIYEAAQGGLAALNGQTYDDEYGRDEYEEGGSVKKRKSRSLKGNPYYKFAQDRRDSSMETAVDQNFAKGGLPPRFLQGAGDGMSDSIKARIGGVQEARLADGEFVVPADVVSHLGNGSSKAGAKKLYAMMDKIRKARTGRTRQAPEVNARRYMPA